MRKSTVMSAIPAALAAFLVATPAVGTPGEIRTIAQLGSCMYTAHKSAALDLLNANSAAASDDSLQRLRDEKTCSNQLPSNSTLDTEVAAYTKGLMRGMIAEAALRSSPAVRALQPLPFQQKSYSRPWFVATGRNSAVDEMSACVADADPAGILTLVSTVPNSSQESGAIGNLNPWLGRCLAAGATLQADRTALRAALADALYQRVRNPALSLPPPKTETPK